MKFEAKDINWDTDGEHIPSLPTSTIIEADAEDDVVDNLSDKYGWCIFGVGEITMVKERN